MLPSVIINEIDSSIISEKYTNEIGAYVGVFEKGPINTPVLISSQAQFKTIFGRGIDHFAPYWYQVFNYLDYASGIYIYRSAGTNTWNSTSEIVPERTLLTISDQGEFYEQYDGIEVTEELGAMFIATTPGEAGNLVKVHIIDKDDYDNNILVFGENCKGLFSYFRTGYVGFVIARDGVVKEIYYVKLEDVNTSNNNYKTIPFTSQYVYSKFNNFTLDKKGVYTLAGGITQMPAEEDYQECHDEFDSKDDYIFDNLVTNQDVPNMGVKLANSRKDIIAFVGLPVKTVDEYLCFYEEGSDEPNIWVSDDVPSDFMISSGSDMDSDYGVDDVIAFLDTLDSSSHTVVVNNIKEQTDNYTSKKILLNYAGDIAGLKSQASITNLYTPGAGLTNGEIKNILKSHINWSNDELEEMYDLNCNFIQRNFMRSQRTFVSEAHGFSRVNVRSLFNHIEREVKAIAMATVFEFIHLTTINKIELECRKILETAKSDRGLSEYFIKIDTQDTSSAIVDPNTVIISIYIKPTYIAEYVSLKVHNNGTTSIG